MSVWNHRVVRHAHPDTFPEVWYEIHEAHYDNDTGIGSPRAITVDGVTVNSATLGGLRWTLERMLDALGKPVLDYETRREI